MKINVTLSAEDGEVLDQFTASLEPRPDLTPVELANAVRSHIEFRFDTEEEL